ncbi:MAG: GNAT family N-acetyltransferase [Planctomycetota bacterium]|jgi:hypothetical protein
MEGEYGDLIARSPASPLSHTLVWRDVLLELDMGEPIYWLAYEDSQLLGAFPAFVRRAAPGAVLNSLPFVQSTGGIISNCEVSRNKRAKLVETIVEAMLDWCRMHDVQIACVIGSAFFGQEDDTTFPIEPDFRMDRVIRTIDLTQPLHFRPSVRNHIKQARKFNPVLKQATSLEQARHVYEIYAENMRRMDIEPHDWIMYERLYKLTSDKGWTRFSWAEVDGKSAAGLISIWHGGIVDYFSVGCTEFGRRIQAVSWLCEQLINEAVTNCARWWNWMASPNRQVYDFKKAWGGMDRTYPIWLWCLDSITSFRRFSPVELSAQFPGYFVLPYDWLSSI